MYCGTTTGDLLQVNLKTKLFKNSGPPKEKVFSYLIRIGLLQHWYPLYRHPQNQPDDNSRLRRRRRSYPRTPLPQHPKIQQTDRKRNIPLLQRRKKHVGRNNLVKHVPHRTLRRTRLDQHMPLRPGKRHRLPRTLRGYIRNCVRCGRSYLEPQDVSGTPPSRSPQPRMPMHHIQERRLESHHRMERWENPCFRAAERTTSVSNQRRTQEMRHCSCGIRPLQRPRGYKYREWR
jgi:hypothetical protein